MDKIPPKHYVPINFQKRLICLISVTYSTYLGTYVDSNRAKSFSLFTHNEEHHVLQQNMRGGIFMSHKKTWSIKTRNAGLSNYVKCTWHDSCLSLNWTFRKQDLEWFLKVNTFCIQIQIGAFSYLNMKNQGMGI